MFAEMVKGSNVAFRDHTETMLHALSKANVPVLVMSAGLGDILVEVLDAFGVYHRNNTKVVSNFLAYNEDGYVAGLDGKMIHVYNKNESAIHDSEYFKVLEGRSNVILLGDSLGDLRMADGVENPDAVLKIGFLNSNLATAEERLPTFLEGYDIVLIDDQTMSVPLSILKKVSGVTLPNVGGDEDN
jgi:HAD superfamily hydrolase (TIGR01544 family)